MLTIHYHTGSYHILQNLLSLPASNGKLLKMFYVLAMDTIKAEKIYTHTVNETLMSLKSEKVPLASFNAG